MKYFVIQFLDCNPKLVEGWCEESALDAEFNDGSRDWKNVLQGVKIRELEFKSEADKLLFELTREPYRDTDDPFEIPFPNIGKIKR